MFWGDAWRSDEEEYANCSLCLILSSAWFTANLFAHITRVALLQQLVEPSRIPLHAYIHNKHVYHATKGTHEVRGEHYALRSICVFVIKLSHWNEFNHFSRTTIMVACMLVVKHCRLHLLKINQFSFVSSLLRPNHLIFIQLILKGFVGNLLSLNDFSKLSFPCRQQLLRRVSMPKKACSRGSLHPKNSILFLVSGIAVISQLYSNIYVLLCTDAEVGIIIQSPTRHWPMPFLTCSRGPYACM